MKPLSPETRIVHGVTGHGPPSRDLAPPIHMTSTFRFASADHGAALFSGAEAGYVYTRIGNPTTDLLQEKLALLEGGEAAIVTASGMAAVAAAAMTLTEPGDNFISCSTLYGGTYALFAVHLKRLNIEARFISPENGNDPAEITGRMDDRTRFLYLETPANPTLAVMDIKLWADAARRKGLPLIVDNTFATPYLQQPLALGASLVVHSATKSLSGHGDVVGGAVVGGKKLIAAVREHHVLHFGPIMSPFNAWLIFRGVKTLAVRMNRHSESAGLLARRLESHPKVSTVHYPGLASHPDHALACRQMKQSGGMIAFEVTGGVAGGRHLMDGVRLCTLAVSLGDCETLIQHPASMTHAAYAPEERRKAGITDGLIRLSVGLEHPDDIMADLDQALAAVP